jgi:hypothetical protein
MRLLGSSGYPITQQTQATQSTAALQNSSTAARKEKGNNLLLFTGSKSAKKRKSLPFQS